MRTFVLLTVIVISSGLAIGQPTIRQVDFKNFTYPLSGPLLGHSELKWLGGIQSELSNSKAIRLKNGENLKKVSSFMMDGHEYAQFEGFTLQSANFADVTGDGKEDAIVVLLYRSGGTQNTNYVYIYSMADEKPKLLAYCHTGDRAYSGLYKVYGDHGELAFELDDPRKAIGDCCSTQFARTRYKWDGSHFIPDGTKGYGPIEVRVGPDKRDHPE